LSGCKSERAEAHSKILLSYCSMVVMAMRFAGQK